ncbi:hypothetical protein lerEdw1_012780 [Lerista edwardsae]|nr:hypothetical protein lerEdw1_012780 [Lerista edwardsae]
MCPGTARAPSIRAHPFPASPRERARAGLHRAPSPRLTHNPSHGVPLPGRVAAAPPGHAGAAWLCAPVPGLMGDEAREGRGLQFAERELRRRGWRRGKGLGKRENGIAEALKVKVKCDTAGVGHSSAEEFTFHWWDHVYNSVAANIDVEARKDGAKVKKISKQSEGITNKKPRKAQRDRNMLYGRFVKAATLTAGTEEPLKPVPSSDSSDEDEKLDLSTARRLTDEELVRVCGGRTAHKGARHGLTMSAKLARLEEQEKAFLASRGQQSAAPSSSPEKRQKKGKKRRKGEERELEVVAVEDQEEEECKKRKKKKKQRDKEGSRAE